MWVKKLETLQSFVTLRINPMQNGEAGSWSIQETLLWLLKLSHILWVEKSLFLAQGSSEKRTKASFRCLPPHARISRGGP